MKKKVKAEIFTRTFFCKADNKRQKLAMILVMHDVWKKLPYTQPLHIVENTKNDNKNGYGIKEYRLNSNEQLFTECCYLHTQMKKTLIRSNALKSAVCNELFAEMQFLVVSKI